MTTAFLCFLIALGSTSSTTPVLALRPEQHGKSTVSSDAAVVEAATVEGAFCCCWKGNDGVIVGCESVQVNPGASTATEACGPHPTLKAFGGLRQKNRYLVNYIAEELVSSTSVGQGMEHFLKPAHDTQLAAVSVPAVGETCDQLVGMEMKQLSKRGYMHDSAEFEETPVACCTKKICCCSLEVADKLAATSSWKINDCKYTEGRFPATSATGMCRAVPRRVTGKAGLHASYTYVGAVADGLNQRSGINGGDLEAIGAAILSRYFADSTGTPEEEQQVCEQELAGRQMHSVGRRPGMKRGEDEKKYVALPADFKRSQILFDGREM